MADRISEPVVRSWHDVDAQTRPISEYVSLLVALAGKVSTRDEFNAICDRIERMLGVTDQLEEIRERGRARLRCP